MLPNYSKAAVAIYTSVSGVKSVLMVPHPRHPHHPLPHIHRLFPLCQSVGCEMVYHSTFHLHLSHDQWGWTSFHIFGHLGFLFCELPVDIFNPFLKYWTVCHSLICTHFRPTSARSQSKFRSRHFSTLDFQWLFQNMHHLSLCSVAQVCPWAENQLQPITLGSTFSSNLGLPLRPSTHLNSSPIPTTPSQASCEYHPFHLEGLPPWLHILRKCQLFHDIYPLFSIQS